MTGWLTNPWLPIPISRLVSPVNQDWDPLAAVGLLAEALGLGDHMSLSIHGGLSALSV